MSGARAIDALPVERSAVVSRRKPDDAAVESLIADEEFAPLLEQHGEPLPDVAEPDERKVHSHRNDHARPSNTVPTSSSAEET